jgi:hypothetical protein
MPMNLRAESNTNKWACEWRVGKDEKGIDASPPFACMNR